MTTGEFVLGAVHNAHTRHCDCLGSGHPEYTDPECCICWKQPCERGTARMWRHLLTELIRDLSPKQWIEVPF